jgi:hypothetical protein
MLEQSLHQIVSVSGVDNYSDLTKAAEGLYNSWQNVEVNEETSKSFRRMVAFEECSCSSCHPRKEACYDLVFVHLRLRYHHANFKTDPPISFQLETLMSSLT